MKTIDLEHWERRQTFEWFHSFANPCYGMDVRMDVTELVALARRREESFFLDFMFVTVKALEQFEEFRLRILDSRVVLFDRINPKYVVKSAAGGIVNCRHEMTEDFAEFYARAQAAMREIRARGDAKTSFNEDSVVDDFYLSCIPWTDFRSVTHPIPDDRPESASIPRICWGGYTEEAGRLVLTLNITVNHALVDGEPLGRAFNLIQQFLNDPEIVCKR